MCVIFSSKIQWWAAPMTSHQTIYGLVESFFLAQDQIYSLIVLFKWNIITSFPCYMNTCLACGSVTFRQNENHWFWFDFGLNLDNLMSWYWIWAIIASSKVRPWHRMRTYELILMGLMKGKHLYIDLILCSSHFFQVSDQSPFVHSHFFVHIPLSFSACTVPTVSVYH